MKHEFVIMLGRLFYVAGTGKNIKWSAEYPDAFKFPKRRQAMNCYYDLTKHVSNLTVVTDYGTSKQLQIV